MSSEICLKLHLDSDILRVRAPFEKCEKMEEICSYVEMAWPDLKEIPYQLYYIDDLDDACVLNQVSLADALLLAEESVVPTLNIYVQPVDEDEEETDVIVEDPLSRVVDELVDLDMIPSFAMAQELAEVLQSAGQDLDAVADELMKTKAEKPVSKKQPAKKIAAKKPTKAIAHKAAKKQTKPLKIQREVSDEQEAIDTMVTDHIKRWADEQHRAEKAESEDAMDMKKAEGGEENEKSGKRLAKLLNDYGFVSNKKSADELVDALEATGQDLDSILYHFIHGPSKPIYRKPLLTPEEQQAQQDAGAKRCIAKQVKRYERKQRKSGRTMQATEPRWGWAAPKHPRDPKADHVDLLD
ncbi:hypothetical protein FOL47_003689 [Perkinsus chesapeaki]|uniref:Uncharacterized protein n=1 Tax=Perkinsus chesapeaki TaxID=330153 RepID=A0A7J6M817_PERCH|nr:hypothetical protein FOL47_003689 [Perkinsus chesapeaki]